MFDVLGENMDLTIFVLEVLAKNKKKEMTSRDVVVRVLELPEMAREKDQYILMEWSKQQLDNQLYNDYRSQIHDVLRNSERDGYVKKTKGLSKDRKFSWRS